MLEGSGPAIKNKSKIPPKDRKVIPGVGCNMTSIALLFNHKNP